MMLPGVELARRRKIHNHSSNLEASGRSGCPRDPRSPCRPRAIPTPGMGEAALVARRRLEQRLGILSPIRCNQQQQQQSERKVVLERNDSARDVCAVCLDGFGAEQYVTKLACSHRYHSDCLMPWLTKHSDCPCCRKVVLT
ncbi:hypothetical protein QJS10_CPB15g01852 [Acorus calamus]|uniref:RING-type domain-containing protein n=1 Tax=Acorus calamus TaxID=4465 RepID=A0AAV9DA96_ACOCL|nr:hypothetical protein QJS10_CPB15g01852 [Acorus calamus]